MIFVLRELSFPDRYFTTMELALAWLEKHYGIDTIRKDHDSYHFMKDGTEIAQGSYHMIVSIVV